MGIVIMVIIFVKVKMASVIRFMCYCNGEIKTRENGAFYDGGFSKLIRLSTEANYEQLIDVICNRFNLNRITQQLKVFYRYLSGQQGGETHYHLSEISDDTDVDMFIDFCKYLQSVGGQLHPELYTIILSQVMHCPEETETTFPRHERYDRQTAETTADVQLRAQENNPVDDNVPDRAFEDLSNDSDDEFEDEEFDDDEGPLARWVARTQHSVESPNESSNSSHSSCQQIDMSFEHSVPFFNVGGAAGM